MKFSLLILPFLALFCQGEPMWQPSLNGMTDAIQGGQVFSNLLLVSSTEAVAPMADSFIGILGEVVNESKRYLAILSKMITSMDASPQLASLANKIQADLLSIDSSLDDIERTARFGGDFLKATADCVAPQREEIRKIKDDTFRELIDVVDLARGAIMDVMAAGYSIEQQMNHLEDIETKVVIAAAGGRMGKAVEVVVDNLKAAEKDARMIERAFAGAAEDFKAISEKELKRVVEILQQVEVEGRKILEAIELCIQPKLQEKPQKKEE